MNHVHSAFLLLGAVALLAFSSCKKDNENPAPTANNGPSTPTTCQYSSTVTDIDGNVYPVVTIGGQHWMAQNLRTAHYNDGSPITNESDGVAWGGLTLGAWCSYANDGANDSIYGKLYNWHAASTTGLCPQGWHLPSDTEWTQLADQLGGWNVAGGKLKANTLWASPNTGATNASCFTAVPSGCRAETFVSPFETAITFTGMGEWGYFWSSTISGTGQAYQRMLVYGNAGIHSGTASWKNGYCVRCVMD